MKLLALEVKASAVGAAVLDTPSARRLSPVIRVATAVHRPVPDAAEVAPEELWSALSAAARQACRDFPDVGGVGLWVAAPWLVLLDKADRPIGPMWTDWDRRARPAARQVRAAVGDGLLADAGNCPVPGIMTAVNYRQQLLDDPYLCHRVQSYLHLNGWLALRITGERAFDRAGACFTGVFGTLTDRQWSIRWCDFFEVDRAWLPPVVCGSTTIGTVRSGVAAELGVAPGSPLKLGITGFGSAMLAANITGNNLLHDVGPVQSLAALVSQPLNPQSAIRNPQLLLTHLLGVGDGLVQVAHNPVGGVAVDWIRNLCFQGQSDAEFLERTLPAALQRTSRELLDPPYLDGDPLAIEARRGAFRDVTLGTDRLDLLAAVVQAMIRGHRQALDALGVGRRWERIVMSGADVEMVQRLLPKREGVKMEVMQEGSVLGVARLFAH